MSRRRYTFTPLPSTQYTREEGAPIQPEPFHQGQSDWFSQFESTSLVRFRWDDHDGDREHVELIIQFWGKGNNRDGPMYQYHKVPIQLVSELSYAQSKGRFVYDHFVLPKWKCTRIS